MLRGWRFVGVALLASSAAFAQPPSKPDLAAPFVATPTSIVDEMLELAGVGPSDFVIDLGSGDGRLVIAAVAKYHARGGFGVDIDGDLVKLANASAAKAGVANRVRFLEQDLFAATVGEATVVTVYLLPGAMGRVEKKLLAELKPGTRVVAHDFQFPTWQPERVVELESLDKLAATGMTFTRLFLYKVPTKR
jgi:protein-L-isoaspartate O-methyltransferase